MGFKKILKNVSGSTRQVLNRSLANNETYEIPHGQWDKAADSDSLISDVNAGLVIVNDGTSDLSAAFGALYLTYDLPGTTVQNQGTGLNQLICDSSGVSMKISPGNERFRLRSSNGGFNFYTQINQSALLNAGSPLQTIFMGTHNSNISAGAYSYFRKSKGSESSPTAIANGDSYHSRFVQGHDGTNYVTGAFESFTVEGTVATNQIPTTYKMALMDSVGSALYRVIHYPTGATVIGDMTSAAAISKLNVAGSILIGSDSASGAGVIKYTSNDFLGHDGTSFKTLINRVPPGGNIGQILTKTNVGDYAVGWSDLLTTETITASSTTTVLTVSSKNTQMVIGTVNGQKFQLPNATTMQLGGNFNIINNTPTLIPVYLNDGTTFISSVYPGNKVQFVVNNIGTTNGIWSKHTTSPNPTEQSVIFDDFITANTTNGAIGALGWALVGILATCTTGATSNLRLGQINLLTTITGNALAAIKLGTSATAAQIFLGNGISMFETYVAVPNLGGTGTARYTLRVGYSDTVTTNDETNGVYFEYAGTVSGNINWTCKTASASSRNSINSGIQVNANQWYKLSAVINSNASSVAFYIDNVFITTIVNNIPTAGLAPSFRIIAGATNNASKTAYIDYFLSICNFSTIR